MCKITRVLYRSQLDGYKNKNYKEGEEKMVGGVQKRKVVDAFFHDRKLYPLFMVVSSFVKDQIGAGVKLLFIPQSKVTWVRCNDNMTAATAPTYKNYFSSLYSGVSGQI